MDIENINITFDYESFSKLELVEALSLKGIVGLSIETIRSSFENFLTPLTDYVNVEQYDINISCHKSFELFHKESYSIKLLIISKFSNRQSEHDILINTIQNEDVQSIISNFILYLNNHKFHIGYVYRYNMVKNETESTVNGSLFLNNNEFNNFFLKYSSYFNFIKIIIAGDTVFAPKLLMSIYSNEKKWSGFVNGLSNDKAILKGLYDIKAFHFNHDEIDKNEIIGMLETNALIGY